MPLIKNDYSQVLEQIIEKMSVLSFVCINSLNGGECLGDW